MSFKHNDNNNMIHLGNYEEFFVLYIDNELSDEQMKLVDDFLIAHPDLQAEFEMLVNTKLPAEIFSIHKEDLMADSMKLNAIEEDLFLYIDNELPAGQKKIVELKLASDKDYQLQHQLLMKSKLDASEKIIYTNKSELYRRTERRVAGMWLRVAAAVIIMAAMGVLYINSNSNIASPSGSSSFTVKTNDQPKKNIEPADKNIIIPVPPADKPENILIAKTEKEKTGNQNQAEPVNINEPENNLVAVNNKVESIRRVQRPLQPLDISQPDINTGSIDIYRDNGILNNLAVTSETAETYNNTNATDHGMVVAGNNDTKGSVKGFLRRATRLIEKRTGIDATSDGELLIGVVAVKLK